MSESRENLKAKTFPKWLREVDRFLPLRSGLLLYGNIHDFYYFPLNFAEALQGATMWLAQNGMKNPNDAGAGAVDYLRLMGIVMTGWMWAKMAKLSVGKDDAFHKDKLMCARYWMERLIPECPMLLERIQKGSENIMVFD